ncbi:Hint domain-containing protein [Roseisalinus antarcticus]|uniref:Hedgehog/Intein (Hint) domain-containing protein n=1 Tax=Roseisalinus antarcticus TaxID=254357 RepID=A0A1Y5SK86_9RHOB|nr:Hint domain-containing protein [Roseisalinus antarcticus]SLN41013.1 hypothetical protein ROA7023_01616 [Roseisalinus antarcticus]
MPIYYFVARNDPSPAADELRAGQTVEVSSGDVYYFTDAADDDVTFENRVGGGIDTIAIHFDAAPLSAYTVELKAGVTGTFEVAPGIDASGIEVAARYSSGLDLTVGDAGRIGPVSGSSVGADTILLGQDATIDGDLSLGSGLGSSDVDLGSGSSILGRITGGGGTDDIALGDRVTVTGDISLDKGADTLTIGDGGSYGKVSLGDGADTLTIGSNNVFAKGIDTGNSPDAVTIGDGNTINGDLSAGAGADSLTIGDGNTITGDLLAGAGADTVTIGDNIVIDGGIDGGDGNDTFEIGDFARFTDFYGGNGADYLNIGFIDGSVPTIIDGVSHDGGDGDTTNDDTLRLAISPTDRAGFETMLANEGYVFDGDQWVADSGTNYHLTWNSVSIRDWENIQVVCFARGTLIRTPLGDRPIEDLDKGDLVCTRDGRSQPIRWIASTTVPAHGHLAPIRFETGALCNARPLVVSPQHRMLVTGWQAELLFGAEELLCPAKALVNDRTIRARECGFVQYFHMLFDRHEIVLAEGAPSESFHPGLTGLDSLSIACRDELFELFPELEGSPAAYGGTARTVLTYREGQVLSAALA